jgi:uncharacterized protein YecA (UPF0149 family)
VGVIAESVVTYARPLFDQTDGSLEKMNQAMAIAQMCWNLALQPEDARETAIDEIKPALNMTDEEFADFRQHLILPMIHRHYEMFPGMHGRSRKKPNIFGIMPSPTNDYPRTGRNAPCPCGSGRKYKVCCGARK